MECTVSAHEPALLIDVRLGHPFLPLDPAYGECLCLRLLPSTPFDTLIPKADHDGRELVPVVVVASRVQPKDPGFVRPGSAFLLRWDAPVILLDLVERIALRERADPEFARPVSLSPGGCSPDLVSPTRTRSPFGWPGEPCNGAEATPPEPRL